MGRVEICRFYFPKFHFYYGRHNGYQVKSNKSVLSNDNFFTSLKNLVIKKDLPLLKVYLGVVTRSLKLFFVGLILGSNGHGNYNYNIVNFLTNNSKTDF